MGDRTPEEIAAGLNPEDSANLSICVDEGHIDWRLSPRRPSGQLPRLGLVTCTAHCWYPTPLGHQVAEVLRGEADRAG